MAEFTTIDLAIIHQHANSETPSVENLRPLLNNMPVSTLYNKLQHLKKEHPEYAADVSKIVRKTYWPDEHVLLLVKNLSLYTNNLYALHALLPQYSKAQIRKKMQTLASTNKGRKLLAAEYGDKALQVQSVQQLTSMLNSATRDKEDELDIIDQQTRLDQAADDKLSMWVEADKQSREAWEMAQQKAIKEANEEFRKEIFSHEEKLLSHLFERQAKFDEMSESNRTAARDWFTEISKREMDRRMEISKAQKHTNEKRANVQKELSAKKNATREREDAVRSREEIVDELAASYPGTGKRCRVNYSYSKISPLPCALNPILQPISASAHQNALHSSYLYDGPPSLRYSPILTNQSIECSKETERDTSDNESDIFPHALAQLGEVETQNSLLSETVRDCGIHVPSKSEPVQEDQDLHIPSSSIPTSHTPNEQVIDATIYAFRINFEYISRNLERIGIHIASAEASSCCVAEIVGSLNEELEKISDVFNKLENLQVLRHEAAELIQLCALLQGKAAYMLYVLKVFKLTSSPCEEG